MTEKTYTESEALQLVEREVLKHRVEGVENSISEGERRSISSFSKLEIQIHTLTNIIEKQGVSMAMSADNLREEIKKDFATKTEVAADFDKLNTKIDTQWSKLVLIFSTLTTASVAAQWLLTHLR